MIVADTGAMIALVDRKDPHHRVLAAAYDAHADEWILPWAILPEVDYLLGAHVGAAAKAQRLGLVDAVVMAVAPRHRARAIATLDVRHFGAARIPGAPQLWPRDLAG